MSDKSLDDWRSDIKKDKRNWVAFYRELMGVPPSNVPRLYRTLNLYGEWPLFDAIIESSSRSLTGDPLNYVLKVAGNKWREEQQQNDVDDEYALGVEKAKEASRAYVDNLAKKIKRKGKGK